MKILITGGAGYLGSVLATQLLAEGHAVRVLDCLMYGRDSLAGLNGNSSFELIAGDLRERDVTSRALQGMDAVVHLAAIVGDPACARNPELARAVNLDAAMQLIELAEHSGIQRFIFASTCSNYGCIPEQSAAVNEDFELKPVSLYAETKVALERRLLAKQSHSFIPTVLRFATLYGLSPRMRFDLTVNEFTHSLFLERRLVVYGKQFWRPYVHVSDAARAISKVLEAPADAVRERVFNVGDTNENYRKSDLVRIIQKRVGQAEIQYVQQTEDPRDYRVSCARIQDELGFHVTKRVADGVNEIIEALTAGVRPTRFSYNVESAAQPSRTE